MSGESVQIAEVAAAGRTIKLAKTLSTANYIGNPYSLKQIEVPSNLIDVNGYFGVPFNGTSQDHPNSYLSEISQCRYFYRYDPVASTVINRMVDMSVTKLRNRRGLCNDEEMFYFNALAKTLYPVLQSASMEYLISGMSIIDYGTKRIMGQKLHPSLGRVRYVVPDSMWVRNPENIVLKRVPGSMKRQVFIRIPDEERTFIMNEGVRSDGTEDKDAYIALITQFPDYVRMVRDNVRLIPLDNVHPILRRIMPTSDWPQPYLVPALAPMKHKMRIKQMDFSIATKAIEAIRLVRAGSDEYPVVDDDSTLSEIRTQMQARPNSGAGDVEQIYSLFTNHTIDISWVYPPIDALLSDVKYVEPNSEIFMAMGFSKLLMTGETGRSNSGNSVAATMGPVSALNEMRANIIAWIERLYVDLADANGFKNTPDPIFSTIAAADTVALAQYAIEAVKLGALSKDTLARMFGSDFETEHEQIEAEAGVTDDTPVFNAIYGNASPTSGNVTTLSGNSITPNSQGGKDGIINPQATAGRW